MNQHEILSQWWRIVMFLPQCVAGFEMYRNAVFVEDSYEFLRYFSNLWNNTVVLFVVFFFSICCAPTESFWRYDKSWVWIIVGFECFLDLYVCSFAFPSALVGMFSVWWCRVLVTPSLCSGGWWESGSKYWSVFVCPVYFNAEVLFNPRVVHVPKPVTACSFCDGAQGSAL